MSSMYAPLPGQKTYFRCWRKPPTRSYSSREVIAHPPPVGPRRSRDAVHVDHGVLVRPDPGTGNARDVVRIVLEVGCQEANGREPLERIAGGSRPNELERRRRRHRARPDRPRTSSRTPRHMRSGRCSVRCGRSSVADRPACRGRPSVPSLEPLFQITISCVAGDVRRRTFSTHFWSRCTLLFVRTTIAMPSSRALVTASAEGKKLSTTRIVGSQFGRAHGRPDRFARGGHLAE